MKTYHVELTKCIVETVEAESYEAACAALDKDAMLCEHDHAWRNAEAKYLLLAEENSN